MKRKITAYNAAVVLFAALGSVIYGYDSSVIATTLGQPSFYAYFDLTDDPTNPGYSYTISITGACNGLAQAGGFFGSFLNAWISDRFGRRATFQVASTLCIVGSAIHSGAPNLAVFLTFRFVNGLGVGMVLTATPLYQSELSPPYARGLLVGSHGAMLAIGYNIASWVGLGCFFASNPAFQWRFPLALQTLFPVLLLAGSFRLPSSPRWLVAKNRGDEARQVLERLHASSDDPHHTFAIAEYDQIVAQIELERRKRNERRSRSSDALASSNFVSDLADLFSHRPYRKRAILGFTLMFGAQCTGVLVINNYQVILFPALGISPALSLGLYSVYLAIALVGNSICGPIVDRFGRRKCLLIGLCGCVFALTGECIFSRFAAEPNASRAILSLAVLFIFLYIPFFSSMIDPNMYIYSSEIFPAEVRSVGVAVSMSGQWLATICFLQSAPTAFANIGYRFYIVFIVCTIALFGIVYRFYPETKGLSLEEMARIFGDEVAVDLEVEMQHVKDELHRKRSVGNEEQVSRVENKE
ncbi:hypothetical protein H2200_013368 [Cladophialophora chaetospira]|uniref:Major facilitator superfamily (MFS) profile domain-containing protein n=1 Tax=Cladophialophora chaetospira TaxID=386627 RepID=A0AA38WW61_9EURO|nr:hypothetical protein H2200_013368 [Cladophialophora chaetospira]